MKTIIAGSRTIASVSYLYDAIRRSGFEITEVVCGEAQGVDKMGRWWAEQNSVPIASYPADWKKFGKNAGKMRNWQMARYADALIAIWDGISSGTAHMIAAAHLKGLKVYVQVVIEGEVIAYQTDETASDGSEGQLPLRFVRRGER